MPKWLNKDQEKKWTKAKEAVGNKYSGDNHYAVVMSVFEKMGGHPGKEAAKRKVQGK